MNEWKMSQFFPNPVCQWNNVLLSQARGWGPVGLFVYAAPEGVTQMGSVQSLRPKSLSVGRAEQRRHQSHSNSWGYHLVMGKFTGGVQDQSGKCYHYIQDTKPSEMQPLAFGRLFSRRVAKVAEDKSGHSWLRAGLSHCPGHLVGPRGGRDWRRPQRS